LLLRPSFNTELSSGGLDGVLARQRALLLENGGTGILGLLETLGQEGVVLLGILLALLLLTALEGLQVALVLQALRSDQTLDLGGLEDGLLAVLVDLALDDVLTNIILLAEVEQLADLGGTLGTQAARLDGVGQTGNVLVTLLDNDQVQDGQLRRDNAAANGLALALTSLARAVARHAVVEQQADTRLSQNTLLHGETLLVVTTRDLEDVALELVTEIVTGDLSRDTLVVESAELAVIIDLDNLLAARRGVRDIELWETKTRHSGCA